MEKKPFTLFCRAQQLYQKKKMFKNVFTFFDHFEWSGQQVALSQVCLLVCGQLANLTFRAGVRVGTPNS
jgi:hypothetical protein